MKQTTLKQTTLKQTRTTITSLILIFILLIPGLISAKKEKPLVQMAILLDTSGSMEGLIEQAKTQLWKIVNEMALARKKGVSPRLEVALYEYGKSSLPASEGYMRMIVPLSVDLDRISEELFKLKTNGGSEYCGQVIRDAVADLQWNKSNDHLKVIFIAGNEPFTQGSIDYVNSCKNAISNSIIVNTIFCGNYKQGIRTKWKHGADLADGKYMNIDHNMKVVHIPAPQDDEIIALGKKLNATYIAFGRKRAKYKARQQAQDSNAAGAGKGAMVQRQMAKSSVQYNNAAWDLVDAEKEGKVKVEELEEDMLPEEMKKMDKKQRKEYVQKKNKERQLLQKKIAELRKSRDKFVAEKRKKMAGDQSLDSAIINAIKEQAKKKKYKFKK